MYEVVKWCSMKSLAKSAKKMHFKFVLIKITNYVGYLLVLL